MSGVAGKAIKGTVLSVVAQIVSQAMRMVSTIVMARYLSETAFGINNFVIVITTGLWMVSDVGIGHAVMRSTREDRDFVDTAWTLSSLRGVVLFVLGCIAGPIAAAGYGQPELLWLVPFVSLMILFLSAESIQIYTLQRNVDVTRVLVIDLVAQGAALGIAIPIAVQTGHVIALAAAAVGSAFVRFVLSHVALGGRLHRPRWDKAAVREIFSFGQWVFLSTLLSFLAARWDGLSLPKLEGFALFGVYGLASQITSVPNQIAGQVVSMVLTPILADAFRGSPEQLRRQLSEARAAYLPAAMLLFLGAATTAPAFFLLAYNKPAFQAAGPMTQVLMLQVWLAFLQEASSRAMVAAGDGRGLAFTNGLKVAATILATLVGFRLGGFEGFVAGTIVGALVGVVVVGVRLRQQGLPGLGGDLGATLVFVALGLVACGGPVLLGPKVDVHPAWLTLGTCALVCGPLALYVVKKVRAARSAQRAAVDATDSPASTTTESTTTTATAG
jgi:O-antigen/teichoic acid export membrane protein